MRRPDIALGLLLLLPLAAAAADKPTKAEIGDRGKAATAFVEVAGLGSGTAFCVHPSGLFVTNEHVVRGGKKAEIKLVLNAGLKAQRVLAAAVARTDKDLDLALLTLKEPVKEELPTLTLGGAEEVRELASVIAFGFPLGAALAGTNEYPTISVNAGSVSGLRRKAGELHRIQIDVSVTFGSSGGPVLDEDGKVVGVVVSGIVGQRGLNLAIPVGQVAGFLNAPVIEFVPPVVRRADLGKPATFTARVVSFAPNTKTPSLRLQLKADGEPAREFPMTGKDGVFTAAAAPTAGPEVRTITAVVTARVGDKDVGRTQGVIRIQEPPVPRAAAPGVVAITPPTLDGEKVVKPLPATFSNVCLGGGGRYLVFHLPKLKKLAVFDVSEAKIVRYIPLAEDDPAFAAGNDVVVVGLRKAGRLERWGLTTGQREKAGPPPFKEELQSLTLGHASNGPLVANGYFLDLATFRALPVVDDRGKEQVWAAGEAVVPSADGTVFGGWNTQYSPATATSYVLEGDRVKRYNGGEFRHVVPGPDGRTLFTGKGVAAATLERGDADDAGYGYCLPAVRGEYFVSVAPSGGPKANPVEVYLRGLPRRIAKLDGVDHGLLFDGWDREPLGPWKRLFLVPDANLLAVLPAGNDRVVLFRFDADAALEQSGQDYLLVTSRPPRSVKPGTTFTYPVTVKAKHGGVTYKLDSRPKGMAVSTAGVVTWAVPADATDGDVILVVRDARGQEVFHTFALTIAK